MKNSFIFLAILSVVLLLSCHSVCSDEAEIAGVEFTLFHSNVLSISDGITTTTDGSEPVSESNPDTVIYNFWLGWEERYEPDVICADATNEITSVKITCNKDFELEGNTITAGTSFSHPDAIQGIGVHFNEETSFSFERGIHTFTLEVKTDNNLTFTESVTTDIQI